MHAITRYASSLLTGLFLCMGASASAQTATPLRPSALALDTLMRSPGGTWIAAHSEHFVVHLEQSLQGTTPIQMLDSLEASWTHAVHMLGGAPAGGKPIHVLVTASRTRFPRLLSPHAKGLTTQMPQGGDIIILVMNDSVRALTRHEVMHVVAQRTWGPAVLGQAWLSEGLATLADGKCQGATTIAVARDLLRDHPTMTADDVTTHFVELWQSDRGRAYVLPSSFVGFLWDRLGRDGVRRLWQGADSLRQSPLLAGPFGDSTTSWRAYVVRAAGNVPGIDAASFRRFACG